MLQQYCIQTENNYIKSAQKESCHKTNMQNETYTD